MALPEIELAFLKTPIGDLAVSSGPQGLVGVEFDVRDEAEVKRRLVRRVGQVTIVRTMNSAAVALNAYFAGRVQALEGLKVAPMGTPFQRQVWAALRRIPPGKTWTYGQLATSLGRPEATRAVGAANGDNPCAVVVPCHRVIGADGKLVGYGGGLERKRWLLQHEGAILL